MSTVLDLPRIARPDFAFPGRKPVGAITIEYENAISSGMKVCVIPNRHGDAINMVDGFRYQRISTQTMRGSATGFASYTSADKHYFNNTSYTPLNAGTSDFSMMIVVAIDPSSGVNNVFHQRNNATPFNSIFFSTNRYYAQGATSSTASSGAVYFGGFDGSSGYDARGAFATGVMTGSQQVFVGTRRSHVWSLYGDGKLLASYNGSAFPLDVTSGVDASAIGGWAVSGSTGSRCIGNIYAVVGWGRALSDAEARSLMLDPYQFLVPADSPMRLVYSAGATFNPGWALGSNSVLGGMNP